MAAKKASPNRRRSIAAPINQNKPIFVQRSKRRAHSIVPGDRLSPLAKARRSLQPRKSILKTSVNLQSAQKDDQNPSLSQSQSLPPSQSQSSVADETNATQSMDLTQDFQAVIHDNASRKSFGRRVSFASHAQVRLFMIQDQHTNSTGSPQSSPARSSDNDEVGAPAPNPVVNNENDYPGARDRRHSSTRYSIAQSEDMDLTTCQPGFLQAPAESSAVEDDDLDDTFNYEDDDMDVTGVVKADILRKRSLSLGMCARQPLAVLPQPPSGSHPDESQSYTEDQSRSQSDIDPDQSDPMEFTIPINKSLRPPAHQDDAWLALRSVTHSGDQPYEPPPSEEDSQEAVDDMDLDDAMQRLMQARSSLPLAQSIPLHNTADNDAGHDEDIQNNSFTSTEDSFSEQVAEGDHTLNVSRIIGRASLGGTSGLSLDFQDSTMDETDSSGRIMNIQPPVESTPTQPRIPSNTIQPSALADSPRVPVFQPPSTQPPLSAAPPSSTQSTKLTIPTPFTFTPRAPSSPSKAKSTATAASPSKPKPRTFSAAFAPPVTRPTPKKPGSTNTTGQTNEVFAPRKRPHPETHNDGSDAENDGRPSPPKRPAVVDKWPQSTENTNSSSPTEVIKPRPLSPSKKAPFQAVSTPSAQPRPTSSLRRPSGHFSRRKSLGLGFTTISTEEHSSSQRLKVSSPKKKANIGLGRASMGSGPSDAWKRFDKNAGNIDVPERGRDTGTEMEIEAQAPVQEALRPMNELSRLTQVSSPPLSPSKCVSAPVDTRPSSPLPLEVDLSGMLGVHNRDDEDVQTGMSLDATEQWREGVQRHIDSHGDLPSISIEQFFEMTGIKFMDELTAPRRSMSQPQRPERNPSEISLTEYAIAMAIDVPQLVLYTRISKDLEAWMKKSKIVLQETERDAAQSTPELFTEYVQADEEGQDELRHQLMLIRTNARGLAKSEWYDWKLQWIEGLCDTATKGFKDLEADAQVLAQINARAEEVIPVLEQEYERVMEELNKEQAEVAEIEASDQEYLNELKASIAEQDVEVEALRAEVAENNSQLALLQERLEEVERQKKVLTVAINEHKRLLHLQESSTRAEVFKLKDELEALEDLHMFRATTVNADLFEYIYASQLRVSIPCRNFQPIISKVEICRLNTTRKKYKDDYPRLSDLWLRTAEQRVKTAGDFNTRQIIQYLSDYWSSCKQLRSQLALLSIKYPLDVEIQATSSSFKATVSVFFHSRQAKAFISFTFSPDMFARWPSSIGDLDCKVEIAYGSIDVKHIYDAVHSRLREASAEDSYACLLDACIQAQDIYS